MDLSIIIVNFNVYDDILKSIESIQNTVNNLKYEIIIVDNNSTNRDIENIKIIHPSVKLILNKENGGFGYANNIGAESADGEYLLFVNPDIIFNNNAIEVLYNFISKNKTAGAAGPVQIKPNSGIEYYYTFFPSIYSRLMQEFRLYMTAPIMKRRFFSFLDDNIKTGIPFEVDWVMGSCMMISSRLFNDAGRFDEAFFLYEEETELQYRLKLNGYKVFMIPDAVVLHNHHSSASKIGLLFVHYQEFRSRIIFDHKRFNGIKFIIRKLLIISALLTRICYFILLLLFRKDAKKKLKINTDLLNFALLSKEKILRNRFDFKEKQFIFN